MIDERQSPTKMQRPASQTQVIKTKTLLPGVDGAMAQQCRETSDWTKNRQDSFVSYRAHRRNSLVVAKNETKDNQIVRLQAYFEKNIRMKEREQEIVEENHQEVMSAINTEISLLKKQLPFYKYRLSRKFEILPGY